MYAIVVPTETGALSFFGRHCHLYSNLCVLRTIHIRGVCVNVSAVESSERMCRIW